MPEVAANGLRFHVQRDGEGPDVVLLHAVTSNLAVWMFSGLPERLVDAGYRVTLWDLRGHGVSERPQSNYTSADMAADALALMDELGIARAALVGHSFGGVTAAHLAALAPERAAAVILSDSFFPGLRDAEPNYGRPNVWVDLRAAYAGAGVHLPETVDFQRLFEATATLTPAQSEALGKHYGPLGKGWLRQLPLLAETTCGRDVMEVAGLTADALRSLTVPLVALYDEFSPFLATMRWLGANVPGCVGEIIPGAKHLAVVESTEALAAAVLRHLARLHPPPSAPEGGAGVPPALA